MATNPYAAISRLPASAVVPFSQAGIASSFRGKDGSESGMRVSDNALSVDDAFMQADPALAAYQSKFSQAEQLDDGTIRVRLQQPGASKYDLMDAIYKVDPATGEYVLQGEPTKFKQQSGLTSGLQTLAKPAMFLAAPMIAPGIAGALGGGILGGAGAGAAIGAGGALLSGSDSQGILKAGLTGGVLGGIGTGIGEYINGPAVPAEVPSGMDLAADAGASSVNSIENAAAQFSPTTAATSGSYGPLDDYYLGGGASDMSVAGPNAGMGGHGFAVGEGAGLEVTGLYPGSAASFTPGETINVTGDKIPAATDPTASLPQADYSNEGRNYPTPESTQGAGGSPVNASMTAPVESGIGDKMGDFFKANPRLALTLLGSVFGGVGGQAGSGGAGAGGDQSGMTATQAPKFQRQYVAPPEGYRPGFDPEHRYFTGIGTTNPTVQPVTQPVAGV